MAEATERRRDTQELIDAVHQIDIKLAQMNEQLGRLVSDAESEKQSRERVNSHIGSEFEKINATLNGTGDMVGLRGRVDRLELSRAAMIKVVSAIWGSLAASIAEVIFRYFKP